MDDVSKPIRTDWEKDYPIEIVDSVCSFEVYGCHGFLTETFNNVTYMYSITQELIEDFGLKKVLSRVEQWHMLVEIYKVCPDVLKVAMDDKSFKVYMPALQSYLPDLQKAEGVEPNNAYYGSSMLDLPAYNIGKICSECDIVGKKIVFQRRMDWEQLPIPTNNNFALTMLGITVRGRFQFCIMDKSLKHIQRELNRGI